MRTAISPPAATPYLVVVVAWAMAFLATCTLEASHQVAGVAAHWRTELAGVATVRLPHDADTVAVLQTLQGIDAVVSATVLPREEVAALLVPWLGRVPDANTLPLPQIIDLRFAYEPDGPRTVQSALPPTAVYDDHRLWAAPLLDVARRVEQLIGVAVGMTAISLVAMVAVAARAALSGAAGTVRTLQLLGARENFIAARFDRGIALRALLGAALGTGFALAALPTVPGLDGRAAPMALLLALPVGASVLAWVTARITILFMIRSTR